MHALATVHILVWIFLQILFSICKYTHTSIHTHDYFKGQNHSPHSVANFPCPCVGKWGLPGGLVSNEYVCNVGDLCLIPGLGRAPGEGMATHSSILVWRIPWKEEETGRLYPVGLQRVRHDWVTFTCVYICVSLFFSKLHLFQLLPVCYMPCCIKHTCPHILYMVNIFGGYIIIIKMAGSMRGAPFKSYSHFKSYNAT